MDSIIIKCLLIILYIINSINLIYLYQDDHYHNRIFRLILINDLKRKSYLYLLIIFLFINRNLLVNIIFILILLIYILINFNIKHFKKIKYTNRIMRLLGIHLLLIISLLIFKTPINGFIFLNILYILINYILGILSSLLEKLLVKKYYKQAKNKINKYKPTIIGITGSCGKTSVKNYLYECLKEKYITYKSPKSYNTLNGLSLTVNKYLHCYDNYFILEMGLSHKNDIKNITKIFKPNISIITEILPSHLETMKSIDNIIHEKMQIISNMTNNGLIIINGDNELIINNIDKYNIHHNKIIKIGFNDLNDYCVDEYLIKKDGLEFIIKDNINNNSYNINSKLIGRHNIYNILIVFSVLSYFNINKDKIISYINNLYNYENRLEIKKYNNMTILNDSYNSNINGFINALEILSLYQNKKYIITPGIVESGSESESIIKKIANKITETCDFCYLINNKNTKYFINVFNDRKYKNFKIKSNFLEAFNELKNEEITLLIENDLTDFYYIK